MELIQEREEENELSHLTAREVMEGLTADERGEECTMPKMGGKLREQPQKTSTHTVMGASSIRRAISGR